MQYIPPASNYQIIYNIRDDRDKYEGRDALIEGGELLVGNILNGSINLVGEQLAHNFLFILSSHETQFPLS